MHPLIELWEKPEAARTVMIAGWRQWADAGAVSSVLPQYLVDLVDAHKIGEIKTESFYLFQVPGTHHFLRPEIQLEEGYRKDLEVKQNEIYYVEQGDTGIVIFLGDEPHLNADQYRQAFFDLIQTLGVSRVAALGGVYGAMPYDREREISCVFSLPSMKEDLLDLAIRLSDYEGGTTIGTYLVDAAEDKNVEMVDFYAFVPAYDFSELSSLLQDVRIEHDFKAWYDLMRRLNHWLKLDVDLTELNSQSDSLIDEMDAQIDELEDSMPQLKARDYVESLAQDFNELSFAPLDEVWERELGDLLEDLDD